MKSKVGLSIILMAFILLPSIPGFAATASAAQPENEWSAHPFVHVSPAATSSPTGYSPSQIQTAYNLPSAGGTGTIAIIDVYDDPTVLKDLNVFSNQFGLLPVNFEEHKMAPVISVNSGWALEISLDVQWAHAIAPNAKILMVEAKTSYLSDLLAAIDYARNRPDVVAISMSWGGSEFSTEFIYDFHFISPYGATFFASSGDNGAGVMWPASSSNVVGVGGTTLSLGASGAVTSEKAWSGSGGGVSAYEAKPAYQTSYGLTYARRAVPDVSYDADPNTGVSVYDSTPYQGYSGWWVVGGTSAGAPQWAAIQALGLSANNNNFYPDASSSAYASYFRDITSGSNGYPAGSGYDLVTGLGSPLTTNYGSNYQPSPPPSPSPPPATADFSISASPSALTISPGGSGSSTVTVTSLNGFSGTVDLTSAPSSLSASLDPSSLTVSSGGSASSTLSITVPPSTGAGTYPVTVTGTSGSSSHSVTVTVTVQAVPSASTLSVTVATDKSTYSGLSLVTITVTVKDSTTGKGLQGASVGVNVYYPSGSVAWTSSGTTVLSGTKQFIYFLAPTATKGTYNVAATASLTGYQTGTGQTTFNVV
jgi:subtilase family serine protease